jgi:creatinine amidohydrolase/Fe(II)-dependent formamide hydrolase-like protein
MTWPQVAADIAGGRTTVVVPFGAVEHHGPYLALDTGAVLADRPDQMYLR